MKKYGELYMDKLKTRVLFISLVILALVSISAVAAADDADIISANQDDFDLSEDTITDVADVSADTQEIVDVAYASKDSSDDTLKATQSNSEDVLDKGDTTVVTASFYHIKNGKWVNESNSTTLEIGEKVTLSWLSSYNSAATIDGYDYPFLYWVDQDGNQYQSIRKLTFTGNGEDYSYDFTAVYDEPIRRSNITLAFYHLKSTGWVNETRSVSVSNGSSGGNGNWLKAGNNANYYGNPASLTYQGRDYTLIYWTGPVNDAHPDGIYQIGDRVEYKGDGTDFTMQFTAVYAVTPSEVTINWEMQSADGVVKQTETHTLSEDAPYTVTMDYFDAKIADYKSFDVGSGEDIKHYEFDHWEDADGNVITEDQVLAFTGMDYSVKYTAIYTITVPTSNVTIIFKKQNADGEVITNVSNVLEPGVTWTINSTTFANQIAGYEEFDLNKVHYTFSHWEDEEGNKVTEDQVFNWTGKDYSKTYIAKYDGIAPATVTVIFTNMSAAGAVSNNVSNDIYQGNSWIINMTKFDNEIANYMNFTYEGKFYNFSHWIDEDGNEVTEPQTFEWADHNYTVTYTAVYDSYELSNVTIIFTNMSAEGSKVTTNESNVLGPGVSWTIYQEKFDNQIANYRNFDDENGVNYEFVQWVDEEGNPVNLPQTFEWTGENQTYTYIAQYKLTKPSNVTVVFNKMSANGPVSSNISNVIAIGDGWTILKAKFDNQIYGYTDFYYQGAHYVFNHWENETNDEVTEQTFEWTGEDYTRTMTAIYDIYPDCNITVIWNMESSDGPVSTNDSKIVRHPDGTWEVPMSTFDKQLPEKEFNYTGYHYVFDHWEDEDAQEVTENQVFEWASENYTVIFNAVYIKTLILETSVSNESATDKPGKPVTVDFTVNDENGDPVPNGTLTVTVDGTEYSVNVTDGKATFENIVLPNTPGEYLYDVTYSGTDYYYPSVGQLNLTVLKVDTSVSNVSETGKPGDTVPVEFDVTDEFENPVANGTLTVIVDGTTYSDEVKDGKVAFDIVLPNPGNYTYDVNYEGNDYYNPSVGQLNLTVQKVDVIVTLPEVINYTGAVVDIVVEVVDEFGELVNEGTITLTIDWGTKLSDKLMATAQTLTEEVHDGKATFRGITLGEPGTYPSKAEYSGTDYYNEAEDDSDVVVLPLDTTTESDDVSGKAGDKKDITADIVDQNGNPVKNGTAVLKVNGKEYTAEVKDGKATFKDVELPDESTEATIEYLGNEYYNPSNTTIQITIIPEDEPIDDNETEEEPSTPTSEKTVPVMPAAGNPIALVVVALLSLVSTVSFGRKK